MGEHLLLESLQRLTRVDAELVAELTTQLVEGVQRLGLPPGPVQGKHSPLVQLLAQRVLCDQLVQLADHCRVVAFQQLAVNLRLDRDQALLVQPRGERAHELEVGQVRQDLAAPQAEASPQLSRR